ncbi:armadillo-type protein [Sporodiniella umbellata]|nr:armadillo-type protein [Sporodiniella umbellata]
MDITTLLSHSLSTDRIFRETATNQLETLAQENYSLYVASLCQIIATEDANDATRMSAGLAVKNSLIAKDFARREEFSKRWLSVPDELRSRVKHSILQSLGSPKNSVGQIAAQVIAAIASIELRFGGWNDLITIMFRYLETDNAALRQSTLQAIGYICESNDHVILATQSNALLTAIVQGARHEEPNPEVRLAAINALINSLGFIRENFGRGGERNFIMQVVCEATQSDNLELQVAAFQCLVRIMQLYYDSMSFYMEKALFGLTISGMNSNDERVALQAIEFWSTVCDEEISVKLDIIEAQEAGKQPTRRLYHFAELALADVLPNLLFLLTKQGEDYDEDDWTVAMGSATCLSLFSQCVGSMTISIVIPFIERNIRSENWRTREAAVMAFGSILDGPEPDILTPLVEQALPTLIQMMQDSVDQVRDTIAWTLGRVCELLVHCINYDIHLSDLINVLTLGLKDSPRIVGNCCWSFINLASQLGPPLGTSATTSALSRFFEDIVFTLLQFTERADDVANCRTSAYEAVSTFVMYSADDCFNAVQKTCVIVLGRLERATANYNQLVNSDDSSRFFELQSSLLGVLTGCVRRLGSQIGMVSDRVMNAVFELIVIQSKHANTTIEDSFLLVSATIGALEHNFNRYCQSFIPILSDGLKNTAEYQLCLISVGIVGDICRALGKEAAVYCNGLMKLLIVNLQDPTLHYSVKPVTLSCFGDIALSLGESFHRYLEITMTVLQQAGNMNADHDNREMVEYVHSLYEGTIDAYVGAIQGLSDTPFAENLVGYLPPIFDFVYKVAMEPLKGDSLMRCLIGIIGDLCEVFGADGQLKFLVNQEWVTELLKEARTNEQYSKLTKETARWAREMVKRVS